MFLNPALTGQIGEDLFRLNAHARSQWQAYTGMIEGKALYETQSFGADLSLLKKRLGIGLYVLKDNAGGGIFETYQFLPTLSYSFIMGDNALTFGAQPMINISQFNISRVGPPGARFPVVGQDFNPTSTYFDGNAGINYRWNLYYLEANIGAAVTNLIEAPQRFLSNTGGNLGVKVPRSYKLYTNIDFDMTERMKMLPGFYGSFQAVSTNFLMGTNFSYKILKGGTYGNSLILGVWMRTNDGNLESVIPKFGMKMNKLQVMMSYDAHLPISKGGNSRYLDGISNSLEISLIFTGKPKVAPPLFEDDFILNPRY